MAGYDRAVKWLREHGGGAALNTIVEEGYEGDGVNYNALVDTWESQEKSSKEEKTTMALHPGETGVCSAHGTYDEYCGQCADNARKALWKPTCAQVPLAVLHELVDAAEQLLAWQPICSLGSSGDLRQKRLRKALEAMQC